MTHRELNLTYRQMVCLNYFQIFTKLFEHVEQLARTRADVRQIRLYVERQNTTAQATYKKMGMHHSHYDMYEKILPLPGQ